MMNSKKIKNIKETKKDCVKFRNPNLQVKTFKVVIYNIDSSSSCLEKLLINK